MNKIKCSIIYRERNYSIISLSMMHIRPVKLLTISPLPLPFSLFLSSLFSTLFQPAQNNSPNTSLLTCATFHRSSHNCRFPMLACLCKNSSNLNNTHFEKCVSEMLEERKTHEVLHECNRHWRVSVNNWKTYIMMQMRKGTNKLMAWIKRNDCKSQKKWKYRVTPYLNG